MQRVEVQEFRERASELLTGTEALTVESHGQAVGVYLPLLQPSEQAAQESVAALAVAAALANGQLTEDEPASLFDLRHPVVHLPNRA